MMKVLLVDDSSTVRAIERSIIEEFTGGDCEIMDAGSGDEGLSRLIECVPDVVFVDGVMGDMDGGGFIRRARALGYEKPIVLVTSESDGRRLEEASRAGASGCIIKPFTPDLFLQRVEELLGGGPSEALL